MRYDVITFGSAVVDVYVDANLDLKKKEMCVPIGSKMLIEKLNFTIGGGGTNSAVSFSRLGLRTGFAGKIGDGHNAGIVLRELKKDKVEFIGVQGKEHTGYSVILGDKVGDRTILTYKGINNLLKFSELKKSKLKAKCFYFSSLMGESFKTQEKLVKYARKNKIKVAFNPSEYQVKSGIKNLKRILEYTDILVLNEDEAKKLLPGKEFMREIFQHGPKIVAVTMGKKGAMVSNGIKKYFVEGHKNVVCRERTGAGDAFASAFVSGIISGESLEESLERGILNSESVIQTPGAKNGLLMLKELQKLRKKGGVRIKVK